MLSIRLASPLLFEKIRWRDRRPAPASIPVTRDTESEALQSVLQAIADLDDAQAAGTIADAEYQEQRADLQSRAVTLMMAQKESKSST